MIMLALAAQGTVATVVPRTSRTETSNSYALACKVADSDWKTHRVEMVQTGGRAYLGLDGAGKPDIFRTHTELLVTADETGQLSGMGVSKQLINKPGYGFATVPIQIGGNKGRATITVSEVSAKQFAITIVRVEGWDVRPYAGFCDLITIPRSPRCPRKRRVNTFAIRMVCQTASQAPGIGRMAAMSAFHHRLC